MRVEDVIAELWSISMGRILNESSELPVEEEGVKLLAVADVVEFGSSTINLDLVLTEGRSLNF